jgi:hypothetical protein
MDGCIYMDNASIHRSITTTSTILNLVNRVKYILPYSYMLNPIENSFVKKLLFETVFGVMKMIEML